MRGTRPTWSCLLLVSVLAAPAGAQVTANNDSCDLSVTPAATLLLPYFKVDLTSPVEIAPTTLVTLVNTSQLPQIARMTIWSDWSYPLLTHDLFLTGYDALSLNVRELLTTGSFVEVAGGTAAAPGALSLSNRDNPWHTRAGVATCVATAPPIPPPLLAEVRESLTTGRHANCGTARIGGTHPLALGFITFDLVANCSSASLHEPAFFDDLLYDNVLIGDYQYVTPHRRQGNAASGSPLVHIRAMPEGGPAGARVATNLPYTFYSSLTAPADAKRDRRQPLPSAFAARYLQGGSSGFVTEFVIWRERLNGPDAACSTYVQNTRTLYGGELVRFDERENPTTNNTPFLYVPTLSIPGSSVSIPSANPMFPPLNSGDVGGWMYVNLEASLPSAPPRRRPLQNWVVIHRFADGRYSALQDAVPLGNGCTPAASVPTDRRTNPIGPK